MKVFLSTGRRIRQKAAHLWLGALGFLALASPSQAASVVVRLKSPDASALLQHLKGRGLDVAGFDEERQVIEVVTGDPAQVRRLAEASGSPFEISAVEETRPYAEIARGQGGASQGHRAGDEQLEAQSPYPDVEGTWQRLRQLALGHPALAQDVNLNDLLALPKTREGRDLVALRVGSGSSLQNAKKKVLFVGQHHARELMTHQAVLDLAEELLEAMARGERRYQTWLQDTDVWFVPVANPDGLDYVFKRDRLWRKNRSLNRDGSRGVDLNRNYGFKWGQCGTTSFFPASEVYQGPYAQSEPETNVMDGLNRALHFQFAVSFHSHGNEVVLPYGCGNLAEASAYRGTADSLARLLGYGRRSSIASGEDFEHHYARYGTTAFLLEIGTSFQPPMPTYRRDVWSRVRLVLPFALGYVHEPYLSIKVVDARSGEPVRAQLSLDEIKFSEGERRETDSFGLLRWRLVPDRYTLRVSASGYEPAARAFSFEGGADQEVRVALMPSG